MELLLSGFLHVGFVLVLALATLAMAIAFAREPGERRLGVFRPLSAATAFSVLSGTCAGVGATLMRAASVPEPTAGPQLTSMVMAGLAETAVLGLLGFALLAVSWLVVAVGLRRQP